MRTIINEFECGPGQYQIVEAAQKLGNRLSFLVDPQFAFDKATDKEICALLDRKIQEGGETAAAAMLLLLGYQKRVFLSARVYVEVKWVTADYGVCDPHGCHDHSETGHREQRDRYRERVDRMRAENDYVYPYGHCAGCPITAPAPPEGLGAPLELYLSVEKLTDMINTWRADLLSRGIHVLE